MMFVTAITNTVFFYNWALPSPSFNLFENVRYQRNISIALGCLDIKLLFSGYAIHSVELMYISRLSTSYTKGNYLLDFKCKLLKITDSKLIIF